MTLQITQLATLLLVTLAGVLAEPWIAAPRTDAVFVRHHEQLLTQTKLHASEVKVVFLGASTIQFWGGNGVTVWQQHYETRHAFNYGIGGDRTENVLWRIEHGELDGVKAKVVVLCVGFNNVNHNDKPADIDRGVETIIKALQAKMPGVTILLVNILPSGHHNHVIHETNKLLARHEDSRTVFNLDLTSIFEVSPEKIKTHLYIADQVHLQKEGYELWHKAMEPLFAKLTGEKDPNVVLHPWIAQARNDAHHKARHQTLMALSKAHGPEEKVVFLGASSVEHWTLDGKDLWHKYYTPRHAYNYGIGGDKTEHVLWRVVNGELDGVKAKLVVLIVGSNNVRLHDHPEDITKGVQAIIQALEAKIPGVKVLLLSILPRGTFNHQVHLTNELLAKLDNQKSVHWLDLTKHFEVSHEKINETLYIADHVHLTKEGYQQWYTAMEPLFAKLIA